MLHLRRSRSNKSLPLNHQGKNQRRIFPNSISTDSFPEYKAELVTLNKNGGVERLNLVLKLVEQEIKSQGGFFKIVSQPTLIGSTRDDIDKEQIIADANKNENDESS